MNSEVTTPPGLQVYSFEVNVLSTPAKEDRMSLHVACPLCRGLANPKRKSAGRCHVVSPETETHLIHADYRRAGLSTRCIV
jgi:hypothetical protein